MSVEERIRAAFAGVQNPYQTHRPVLCEAVLRVPNGLILELGSGEGSTSALHEVCLATGRPVVTLDNDPTWISRFEHFRTSDHAIVCVDSWAQLDNPIVRRLPYAIAFVDHAPAERRVVDLAWLADRAKIVVVHDTENPGFAYDSVFQRFRYSVTYRNYVPWTSVLSNFVDVSGWSFDAR